MCGICGFNWPDKKLVKKMAGCLRHRGPDAHGIYLDDKVSLGHTRLSVIDLSEKAGQPMTDNGNTITYNGEIYNYQELREELEEKGHSFISDSDTEVLLKAYREYGTNCIHRLNGMFAFAIWDSKEKKFWLGRDRMGQKPLYYYFKNGEFAFASELKALMKSEEIAKEIDLNALSLYLAYEYVPPPHTIIKDVCKLLPGHTLIYTEKGLQIEKYWDISFHHLEKDREEIKKEIRDKLRESVKRRLVSDVPLGVFLSGGLDSSIMVYLMSEIINPGNIKTFSIAFEEESFDESKYARNVAEYFNTDHREKTLKAEDMHSILEEVVQFMDEPSADASTIPTYLLSKFTREYVTVALGGDGGDELFCGYPTLQAEQMVRPYMLLPNTLRNVIKWLVLRLPVSTRNISLDFKLKKFVEGAEYPDVIRHQVWLGSFTPEEQKHLFSGNTLRKLGEPRPYELIKETLTDAKTTEDLDKLIYFYSKFYLGGDILMKVDRASMAVSLEARSPFLDHEFMEAVNNIPPGMKLKGLTTKMILKEAFGGKLPADIISRPKKGFGIPVAEWIKNELKEEFMRVFDNERLGAEGLFNPDYVKKLMDEHLAGRADHRKKLWTLFIFQRWRETHLG